jgi:hypothetical protein
MTWDAHVATEKQNCLAIRQSEQLILQLSYLKHTTPFHPSISTIYNCPPACTFSISDYVFASQISFECLQGAGT